MTLDLSDWPMDIDLARTFLEIVRCGSLAAAAEKLHVTQTAITARVERLARQLRNFARPDTEAPRRVNLVDLAHGAVSLLDHRMKAQDIALIRDLRVVLILLSMLESRCSSCDPAVENCSNSYRSSGGSFGGWSSGGGHK